MQDYGTATWDKCLRMITKFRYAKNVHIEYFDKIHGAKIKYFALNKVGTFGGIMVDLAKVLLVDHLGCTLLAFPFKNLIVFYLQ